MRSHHAPAHHALPHHALPHHATHSISRVTDRVCADTGRNTECDPGPPATTILISSGFSDIGTIVSGPSSPSSARRAVAMRSNSLPLERPARSFDASHNLRFTSALSHPAFWKR